MCPANLRALKRAAVLSIWYFQVLMIAARVKAFIFDYEPEDQKQLAWDAHQGELVDTAEQRCLYLIEAIAVTVVVCATTTPVQFSFLC